MKVLTGEEKMKLSDKFNEDEIQFFKVVMAVAVVVTALYLLL